MTDCADKRVTESELAFLRTRVIELEHQQTAGVIAQLQLTTLLDALPIGVAIVDARGEVVAHNSAMRAIWGVHAPVPQSLEDYRLFRGWWTDSRRPVVPEDWPLVRALTHGATARDVEIQIEAFDGQRKTILNTAMPIRDTSHQIIGALVVVRDVTPHHQVKAERERLMEQLQGERALLHAVIQQLPDGVIIAEAPSGRLILGNEQVETLLGHPFQPAATIAHYPQYHGFHSDGRRYEAHEWPLARAITTGEIIADEEIIYCPVNEPARTLSLSAAPIRNRQGTIVAGVVTIRDVTERRKAEQRLRFLADASMILDAALDYTETLSTLATLIVPQLADWCTIHIVEADGAMRQIAAAHRDPDTAQLLQTIDAYSRRYLSRPYGPAYVIRTQQAQVMSQVPAWLLHDLASDPTHLRLLRQIGFESVICVPLTARGATLGALSLAISDRSRRFLRDDVVFAEELARRAALAIDNARLFSAEQQAHREAERSTEQIQRLQTVTAALSEALTPEQVAQVIVEQGIRALNAKAGTVTLIRKGVDLEIVGAFGYHESLVSQWRRFPLASATPIGEAVRTGALVLVESPEQRDEHYPSLRGASPTSGQAWAAIPLIVEGRVIGALGLSFAERRSFNTDEQAMMRALAHHCAQALERARLYDAERQARAAAEAAQQRIAFLAEASRVLADSLDHDVTLARVAELTIPYLADLCGVHLVEERGALRQVALACADPAQRLIGEELSRRYPFDITGARGGPAVIRSGRAELVPTITDEMLAHAAHDDAHLALLRSLNLASYMIVPLLARGKLLGLLTLVMTTSQRHYTADDLQLAEDLARRAAVAVDNARLFREAQEAVQVRDEFLSIATHELNTPITSLLGFADILRRRIETDDSTTPRDRLMARTIHEQSLRLHRLLSSVLDVSRLRVGQFTIERSPMDLGALTRRAVDNLRTMLETHTITLSCPDGPVPILGDELRLEQVILNLLQNAVKYSPGGGAIVVDLRREHHEAVLAVSDQGVGIPAESLPRLFSRFYRASNINHRRISGLGLGLFIVREIITLHGGTITAASEEGRGSTFTIRLPLHTAA